MSHFSKNQFSDLLARLKPRLLSTVMILLLLGLVPVSANTLQDIGFSALPGNSVQVVLTLAEPVSEPASFSTDNPARIAIDLEGTNSALAKKSQTIGIGMARSVTAVEAGNKTRVVLNLVSAVSHKISTSGNLVLIDISGGSGSGTSTVSTQTTAGDSVLYGSAPASKVSAIDFKRGDEGKGEVIIKLSDPDAVIDMRQEAGKVILDVIDSGLAANLSRKLDVSDFATPVKSIETRADGNNVRVQVESVGDYDHLGYQMNDTYVLEVRPMTKQEVELAQMEKTVFTGDRLSLNFQDIEVRSVLQLLADFTGLNMVVSDTVTGNVTLRLKNVPWDQAMDIILRTKGLSMRQTENVVLIAPTLEINSWEKSKLEAQKEIQELAPLRSELIQINYAKAANIAILLKQGTEDEDNRLLSERGNVTIDERTNSVLVQDTADKIEEIRSLISKLDIPVRQVMIESRIVAADDTYSKDLGARLGLQQDEPITGGILEGADLSIDGSLAGNIDGSTAGDLLVDLGTVGAATSGIDFVLATLGRHVLSLELTAMQEEGKGEIISSPRVLTADKSTATIRQGLEKKFETTSSNGTNTDFREAVLELKVTPQITPDDRVFMNLNISKNNFTGATGEDIAKREINTNLLVDNGETVVLGGVFEREKRNGTQKVPLFGDLPYVGFMFRQTSKVDDNRELLIFVTPKIVKETLTLK